MVDDSFILVAGNVASSSNSEREESLVVDEEDDILIYSNSEITVFAFAEVLNALQTANAASLTDMDRVCAVIKALLPDGGTDVPSARELRAVLLARIPRMRRIHACSQDCVLFYGEHAQLLRCPNPACRRLRYYQSGTGRLVPVNVFRAIPIGAQLRLLFSNPVKARAMRLARKPRLSDDEKGADITESVGFHEVVFESGFMTDARNAVLLLGLDGGNPFQRERVSTYSVWPFLFFILNMVPALRLRFSNILLGGLVSGHVFVNGVKRNRSVKNLNAYLDYFVTELLLLGDEGELVLDMSYPALSAERRFRLKAMLLGVMGDYDALGQVLNIVGAGNTKCCIKCNIAGVHFASVNTRVFGQHRRYCEHDDSRRSYVRYGAQELTGSCPIRGVW